VGSKKYVWNKGKLTRIYDDVDENEGVSSEDIRFTYNAYGQRISKTYSYDPGEDYYGDFMTASTTTYTYDGMGRLIREYCTESYYESDGKTRELIYLYDEMGIVGVLHSLNGAALTTYYYRRNPQGDVTAIYTTTGTRVGEYAYDAFGNCTILYGSTNDLVKNNPILYRSYYYDKETNLYYLNARYYNPQWRRFISPDSTAFLDPESVNGLNLYCYCYNDTISYCDPTGHSVSLTTILIGEGIGFDVGFGLSIISDLIFENEVNLRKAIVSGVFGAVSGALANMGIPFAALVISNALLSAANSVVDDVFFYKNKNVANIVGNALISASMSIIFTLAIGNSNSKITNLYDNAKYAKNMIAKGGLHPRVRIKYNNSIIMYNKELKKVVSNSIKEALCVSPIEKFFSGLYEAYYKSFFMR
ncbi:MAG: RHS repeat-associated core domain-containing protein, partial [Clostridia bacterium]|nr:RHS repeat-associated core domain-containing protein [Clostridia bacterium]